MYDDVCVLGTHERAKLTKTPILSNEWFTLAILQIGCVAAVSLFYLCYLSTAVRKAIAYTWIPLYPLHP